MSVCLLYSGCISTRPGVRGRLRFRWGYTMNVSAYKPTDTISNTAFIHLEILVVTRSATIYHKGRTYPMSPISDPVLVIWLQSGMTKAQGKLQNMVPLASGESLSALPICQLPSHLLLHQGWIITVYLRTGKDGVWHRGDLAFLQARNILHLLTPSTCHFVQDKAPSHSVNTGCDRAQYLLGSPPTPELLSISNHQTENCISKISPPPNDTACSSNRCWAPCVFLRIMLAGFCSSVRFKYSDWHDKSLRYSWTYNTTEFTLLSILLLTLGKYLPNQNVLTLIWKIRPPCRWMPLFTGWHHCPQCQGQHR